MKRSLLVLAVLLAIGGFALTVTTPHVVAGKTNESVGNEVRICLLLQHLKRLSTACIDYDGKPLSVQCYDDAIVGAPIPKSCNRG